MMLKITDENRATAQSNRDDVAVLLADHDATQSHVTQLQGRRAGVEVDLLGLRQNIEHDLQAVAHIAALEREYDSISAEIADAQKLLDQKRALLVRKARIGAGLQCVILGDSFAPVLEAVAQGMLPFYNDVDRARGAARSTDLISRYSCGLRLLTGQFIEAADAVRELLQRWDSILDSRLPFWNS